MKFVELREHRKIHHTEFENDVDLTSVVLYRKFTSNDEFNKILKIKNILFFDSIVEESEMYDIASHVYKEKYDVILIKSFDFDFSIKNEYLKLLETNEIVFFTYTFAENNSIPIAALIKNTVFKSGFHFSKNLSFNFLSELNGLFKTYEIMINPTLDEEELSLFFSENELDVLINKIISKNDNVIFTFCNKLEDLPIVKLPDSTCDYVCFTNTIKFPQHNLWKFINTSFSKSFIKLNAFRFLIFNYKKALFVDTNLILKPNIKDMFNLVNNTPMLVLSNNSINCTYEVCKHNLFERELIKEHFPKNIGFVNTSLFLQNYENDFCVFMLKNLWRYMMDFEIDENTAFYYTFWKCKGNFSLIQFEIAKLIYVGNI